MLTLTPEEHHCLDWLCREDWSLYGECKGPALSALRSMGYVEITADGPNGGLDWHRVAVTEEGRKKHREVGPWVPAARQVAR